MTSVMAGGVEEIAVLNPTKKFIPYFFCMLCALVLLASAPLAHAQIVINPTTLPNGAVGATYGQVIAAGGGTAPISFKVSDRKSVV